MVTYPFPSWPQTPHEIFRLNLSFHLLASQMQRIHYRLLWFQGPPMSFRKKDLSSSKSIGCFGLCHVCAIQLYWVKFLSFQDFLYQHLVLFILINKVSVIFPLILPFLTGWKGDPFVIFQINPWLVNSHMITFLMLRVWVWKEGICVFSPFSR